MKSKLSLVQTSDRQPAECFGPNVFTALKVQSLQCLSFYVNVWFLIHSFFFLLKYHHNSGSIAANGQWKEHIHSQLNNCVSAVFPARQRETVKDEAIHWRRSNTINLNESNSKNVFDCHKTICSKIVTKQENSCFKQGHVVGKSH